MRNFIHLKNFLFINNIICWFVIVLSKDRISGVLQPHKWENAMTIDTKSWGYRRNAVLADFLSIEELLHQLSSTVACGGKIKTLYNSWQKI